MRIHHLTSFAGCQERQPRVRFPRGLLSLLSKTEALSAERRLFSEALSKTEAHEELDACAAQAPPCSSSPAESLGSGLQAPHSRSSVGCARSPRPSPSPGPRSPSHSCQGFLGTGKTTLLRNLLEEASQDKDSKVGVVVNDMAAVNIDAKITARRLDLDETDGPKMQGAAEFVEIGDGCVCCSMADELFTTLAELAAVSSMKGYRYNHIVIEATGIAEPRSIRDQFQDAEAAGMPLMDEVELSTLVTVVDSAAFLDAYAETASIAQRPDLAAPVDDDPSPFLMARFDHSLQRSVVDLLVEQVECADVLLLNKKDLVSEKQMDRLAEIMRALNPTAIVKQCEFGDAALNEVLGVAGDEGAARIGPVDEHKVAVAASKGPRATTRPARTRRTCTRTTRTTTPRRRSTRTRATTTRMRRRRPARTRPARTRRTTTATSSA